MFSSTSSVTGISWAEEVVSGEATGISLEGGAVSGEGLLFCMERLLLTFKKT